MKKPYVLCIMDGFGMNPDEYGNAVKAAKTPVLDELFAECPNTEIGASGLDVGLPDGQMGNSEVGHTNIGAGRIVYQELTRISKMIDEGEFFQNEVLLGAVENCKKNKSALHLMGLLSDGGVHSHNSHLYALLELAKKHGLQKVFIHCILDGRDVPPTSGIDYLKEAFFKTKELEIGKIGMICGRYYAMDREKRFDRVKKAYDALTKSSGEKFTCGRELLEKSYSNGITDEFVIPAVNEKSEPVKDGDSFIFFNFRPDRAREITRAFVDKEFNGFERDKKLDLYFVCMTQYDALMPNVHVAYLPQSLDKPFGQVLSERNLKQLRIAEYTKYAHVTFFLNGGTETVYEGEDRILIDSPNVATYDLKPEMSAFEVTQRLISELQKDKYDAVVLNLANCDMVGHTGVFDAAVKAVETVDTCVGKVLQQVKKLDGVMIITADHGNADKMYEPDGSPFTAHTTNPVPVIVANNPCRLRDGGRLCDLVPTILEIMGIPQPMEMKGKSLII
ncbi:MAG: 2,3-bisphosphoglycerate-independent phosphoglycerate mutase [Firmicutes bacterium ADurb.Bin300]|nr:MAG: 2,3-bisphosphoglycerate-independent phosphoglycerate mutase [Firmicutes bacterium ADurb.Bin300]